MLKLLIQQSMFLWWKGLFYSSMTYKVEGKRIISLAFFFYILEFWSIFIQPDHLVYKDVMYSGVIVFFPSFVGLELWKKISHCFSMCLPILPHLTISSQLSVFSTIYVKVWCSERNDRIEDKRRKKVIYMYDRQRKFLILIFSNQI